MNGGALRRGTSRRLGSCCGEVPEDVTAAVQRLEVVESLRVLLRQALTCASLEALRDALRTVQG